MINRLFTSLAVLAVLGAAACDKKSAPAASSEVPTSASAVAAVRTAMANPALLSPEKAVEKAPDVFKAKFVTTKGDMVVEVHRDWSPNGADRFYNLVKIGYYDDVAFFRVINGFMAQVGIHGDPNVSARWRGAAIPDDKPVLPNKPGTVCFAMGGPNTRTTQIFFSIGDNSFLDGQGFSAFGKVVEGAAVIPELYNGYGDSTVDQGRFQMEGNAYAKTFPKLDSIKTARLIP
ncbi:MAG: peptidylprolyl isomerase [Elusimicrobiota bacterium]